MVDSTTTEQGQVQPLQQLSTSFRPDLNAAARTTFGVPEAPVGDAAVIPEQVVVQDIRTTSPAPTENDLRTPNMELERVLNEELPSAWEVFKVNAAPVLQDWWSSEKDRRRFERDPLFSPKEGAEKFFQDFGMLSEDENVYLNKAVRYEDFEYRKQRLLTERAYAKMSSQRPWIATASGLLDIDLATIFLPPVFGATRATTGAKLAARSAQATAAATGATLTNQALEDYSTRTDEERDMDTVMFGLVGFLTDVNRVQRATTASTTAVTAPPSTPVPPQVTLTPIETGVRTEVVPPNLSTLQYQSVPAATDATLIETRGTNLRFHGTSTPLPNDLPTNDGVFRTSPSNIYGEGFYTTEAVDIAKGYTRKGSGGAPTLYKVEERSPVPVYDMDAPITPELTQIVDNTFGDVLKNVSDDYDLSTLAKVFDAVRAESRDAGWSKYDVQDAFFSVRVALEDLGFRGLTHTGGAKTGKEAHNVKIYWYPEDDLLVTRDSLDNYSVKATTGEGVKQQYQVPSSTVTTVQNPLGYGVRTQQAVDLMPQ